MNLKFYNSETSSQNFLSRCFSQKNKVFSLKNCIVGKKNSSGRNHKGKITVYCKGGGHKRNQRLISFDKNKLLSGIITNIEYDPNRTSLIMAVFDLNLKNYFYSLAPFGIQIGDLIQYSNKTEVKLGNKLQIKNVPLGCFIHNLSFQSKTKLSRAAGSFSVLIEKTFMHSKVKASSGQIITVPLNSYGTIGIVSNINHSLTTLGKAGRNRWLNKRPKVRGVAMNPVDHPHGGGEGKTSGGRPSVTPWGKPTRNVYTRKKS